MRRACVYIVTDRRATGGRDLPAVLDAALARVPVGRVVVQLREKDLCTRALLALAREVRQVTRDRAALFINDRVDIALAVGADGVHVPETGFDIESVRAIAGERPLAVGVSTHSRAAAERAAARGADIICAGPVWATPSKAVYGPPLGLAPVAQAARLVHQRGARLFALGGVTSRERARAVARAGVPGVAGIRVFMTASDPGQVVGDFIDAMENAHDPLRSADELG